MAEKLMIYSKIRELKADGFSQRKIARQLSISRSTVRRYQAKDSQEFSTWLAATKNRTQKLDRHKERILSWLRQYPELTAGQVHDWLEERGFTNIAESTLRRYIKELREDYQILKEYILENMKLFQTHQWESKPKLISAKYGFLLQKGKK